jgi:hypothetical protein
MDGPLERSVDVGPVFDADDEYERIRLIYRVDDAIGTPAGRPIACKLPHQRLTHAPGIIEQRAGQEFHYRGGNGLRQALKRPGGTRSHSELVTGHDQPEG